MREIKFRGIDSVSGNWRYGHLYKYLDGWWGIQKDGTLDISPVLEKSIGEFTGLHDKNGKEIWEGDILWSGMRRGDDKGWTKEVVWSVEGEWMLLDRKTAEPMQMQHDSQLREVLGNIYENKELLP